MPAGRPTIYSQELAQDIYNRVVEGASIPKICQLDGMPHRATIWAWMKEKPEFSDLLTRARKARAHFAVEQIIEIADEATPDDWQVKRLKIEAIKNYAKLADPESYGDRTEITGAGGAPLVPQIDAGESMRRLVFAIAGAAAGLIGGADANQAETETIEGQAKRIPDGGVSDS